MDPAVALRPPTPLRPSRRRRVLDDIARIFSTICNPFVTSLALFVFVAHETATGTAQFWPLFFTSTMFTSIGPMLYVLWLYSTDRITDLDMSVRSERQNVFSIFVFFYTAGTVALFAMHAPRLMTAAMAGYAGASLVVQYITRSWKISTHALGITAPLVVMVYLYGTQPLPFFILIPLVGWSRIRLHAHTPLQVAAGTCLGAGSVLLFLRLFGLV
ncbi:MAG: phosphatase PAP2 family protein [Candidatus Eremiobacteraeota bacterium]|nr:phosphatase PAP2 family protein [Candidatus Eremiobacteraeota bacterium]